MSLFLFIACLAVLLVSVTAVLTTRTERRFPVMGAFVEVDETRLHHVDLPAGPDADLPTMVFIHGAGGNVRDLHGAFAQPLAGRARMIFVDRPGSGYSGRKGNGDSAPQAQADAIAGLIEKLVTGPALIVGHSFGGAVAAALAVLHPEKVAGVVFIAPATHPWPGDALSWYNHVSRLPLVGPVFTWLVAIPFGHLLYTKAVKEVFAPDRLPSDYEARSGTRLALRPASFRHNAVDLAALKAHLVKLSPRYPEIKRPVTIVIGDGDTVTAPELHSKGLERDIEGARLVSLAGRGHMSSYSATADIVAEIEKISSRIAGADASGDQMPERPSLAT